jgi:predicted alpha/beta-fold hydrolase
MSLDFRPLPLLRNPHVQTILGHFLPGRRCPRPNVLRVVPLPDGDALALHDNVPRTWRTGEPVALLVHGLGGTADSPHVCRLARALLRQGVRAVRMDLRGTGRGLPLARRPYHAGRSDDVRAALEELHRLAPASPLYLVGVSLGGALSLRMAGEAADRPVPNLVRVAALAPPLDLVRCEQLLALRRNRIYEKFFLRGILREVRARRRLFPELPDVRFPRRLTMRHFDDLYTAPLSGFEGALDYYRLASAAPLVPRIGVPALVLTARDDPFVHVGPFEELTGLVPGNVTIRILPHGGHVGFLGWDGAGGIRWAERWLLGWVLGRAVG